MLLPLKSDSLTVLPVTPFRENSARASPTLGAGGLRRAPPPLLGARPGSSASSPDPSSAGTKHTTREPAGQRLNATPSLTFVSGAVAILGYSVGSSSKGTTGVTTASPESRPSQMSCQQKA